MNNIKSAFTIKDLENLSGIKAHTIRIWEKRYNVLQPMRTDTNIRVYDVKSLQKLLNINTLNTFGYKISNIAKLPEERIPQMVKEIMNDKTLSDHVLRDFKLAMVNFDTKLFLDTYNKLLTEKPFTEIFYEYFMPFLHEVGNLWQTDTITPAHEHFISNLIKQKIIVNIELLQSQEPKHTEHTYVLYLPEGEIHEIGLMHINYELLLHGYHTVYLGESIPMEYLVKITDNINNVIFVTYVTIKPALKELNNYINRMKAEILDENDKKLIVFGRGSEEINRDLLNDTVSAYTDVRLFTEKL